MLKLKRLLVRLQNEPLEEQLKKNGKESVKLKELGSDNFCVAVKINLYELIKQLKMCQCKQKMVSKTKQKRNYDFWTKLLN